MVPAMTPDAPLPSATEVTMKNVRDYVARCGRPLRELALAIDLDEKSLRQVRGEGWNPRATTLRKIERLLPEGWQAGDPIPDGDGEGASAAASETAVVS